MSQTLDPGWVSVPFAKFSHNSSPYGTRSFTWNHVGRNDLDFILQKTTVFDENENFRTRMLMKINAGAEELELQDLGELVQHVHSLDSSSGGEIPVQIVIKPPFLAMRYPKSANIVRRIQLKFNNDSDFTKVFNLVKDLGLPITTITPAPPAITRPPSISPSPSSLSAMSGSTALTVPSISGATVSAPSTRISLPTPGSLGTEPKAIPLAKPLSISEFKVPTRPNSSFSSSALPYNTPPILRPSTSSALFSRIASSACLDLSHNYLNQPSSVYISQMDRESQIRRPSLPVLPNLKSSQESLRPILPLFQSQMNPNLPAPGSSQPDRYITQSPFFVPRPSSPDLGIALRREPNASSQEPGSQISEALDPKRIAAAVFEPDERLTIPPRRELPFPKPRETKPRSASIPDLSPLPKPTPVARPASANLATLQKTNETSTPLPKPAKKRVAQRKSIAVKAPEVAESPPPEPITKHDAVTSPTLPEDEPSPLALKSAAAAPRPASAASALQSKAATASKKRAAPARPSSALKRSKMVDQSTQTRMLPNHIFAPQSFRSEDTTPAEAHPVPDPAPAPVAPPESYLDAVDAFVTKHKARPAAEELWDQPGWNEADVEQRQLLLNNFICQNIENNDFLKLCEDMAVSWKRIGLGL